MGKPHIAALTQELEQHSRHYRRLHTSHAFHSSMMDVVLPDFAHTVRQVTLHPPKKRYISNVSGTWITDEEATSPEYWVQHLRQPVQFAAGIQELASERNWLFLEIGAGNALNTLVRQNNTHAVGYSSLRRTQEHIADQAFLLQTLGQLWQLGVRQIRWEAVFPGLHVRVSGV